MGKRRSNLMQLAFAAAIATMPFVAPAQSSGCRIEPFQGATLPAGATAHMSVTNTGKPCAITNYGVPTDKRSAADAGSITTKPNHGSADFVAPQARYTPATGFSGDDEFAYEAFAKGASGQRVRLAVRVMVVVRGP